MTAIARPAPTTTVGPLLRGCAFAAVAASAATEALRAVVSAAGVPLAVGNPGGGKADLVPVAFGACTVMIVGAMVVGFLLAAALNRRAAHPAAVFTRVAVVLVALSLLAPATAGATSIGTKLTLIATHLVAGAIVVPIVSRRLRRSS